MPPELGHMSWLDYLSRHPIFLSSENEYSDLNESHLVPISTSFSRDFSAIPRNFASQYETSGLREDNSFDSIMPDSAMDSTGKRSVIAIRDGDLIVAIGNKLRMLSLVEFRNAWVTAVRKGCIGISIVEKEEDLSWVEKVPYKKLSTPSISFPIRMILVNPNGLFLAVAGHNQLMLVVLPRPGFSRLNADRLDCRTHKIGTFYHEADPSARIVQMQWHPLAGSSSHLVILTMDGIMRTYDIARNLDEPEQTFDFNQVSARKGLKRGVGFAPPPDDNDAVSFCFGKDDGYWGAMTVYVLMKNGDVYSMCPMLPSRCSIARSTLDNLACLIKIKRDFVDERAKKEPLEYMTLAAQSRLQYNWVREVLEQVETSQEADLVADDFVRFQHPPPGKTKYPSPQRQGPYLFQPAPAELSEEQFDASDILYLGTGPISVLAIVFADGKVDICLEVEKVEARWDNEGSLGTGLDSEGLPVFAVYETIDLGLPKASIRGNGKKSTLATPSLIGDAAYSDQFYVYHNAGAHAVLLNPWLNDLKLLAAEDGTSERGIVELLQRGKQSDVTWMLNSMPVESSEPVPVIGCVTSSEIHLAYSILFFTVNTQMVGCELSYRIDTETKENKIATSFVGESQELVGGTGNDENTVKYLPLLPLPAFRLPVTLEKAQGLPRRPRVVNVPNNQRGTREVIVDEEGTRFLAKTVESFRDEIQSLILASHEIHQRIQLQKEEVSHQITTLNKINNNLNDVLRPAIREESQFKIADMMRRHEDLTVRADTVLQILMDRHEPQLSEYERSYFEELNSIRDLVRGERGFEARAKKLSNQFALLKNQIDQMPPTTSMHLLTAPDHGPLSRPQLIGVEKELTQQSESLVEIKNKVEYLEMLMKKTRI